MKPAIARLKVERKPFAWTAHVPAYDADVAVVHAHAMRSENGELVYFDKFHDPNRTPAQEAENKRFRELLFDGAMVLVQRTEDRAKVGGYVSLYLIDRVEVDPENGPISFRFVDRLTR